MVNNANKNVKRLKVGERSDETKLSSKGGGGQILCTKRKSGDMESEGEQILGIMGKHVTICLACRSPPYQ